MGAIPAFLLHPTARRAAQIAAGLIFLASALAKLADLSAFAGSIHNFHLEPFVPMAATNLLAITIPWVELIAGLALVVGVRPRAGAVVYTVLLGVFTIGAKKLAENVLMMAVGMIAAVERR